ncbi:hypothetical protein AB1N83_008286 [Pleurotus pulmonarius]
MFTDAEATKLLLTKTGSNLVATGVAFTSGGKSLTAKANKEAPSRPLNCWNSGIGQKALLTKLKIPVLQAFKAAYGRILDVSCNTVPLLDNRRGYRARRTNFAFQRLPRLANAHTCARNDESISVIQCAMSIAEQRGTRARFMTLCVDSSYHSPFFPTAG